MEPEDKVRIRKNYTALIEDLQVEYFVLDYLFQQGVYFRRFILFILFTLSLGNITEK